MNKDTILFVQESLKTIFFFLSRVRQRNGITLSYGRCTLNIFIAYQTVTCNFKLRIECMLAFGVQPLILYDFPSN